MPPADLRAARERLGLSQAGLAEALRMGKHGGRTVRRWELGEIEIPGPVQVAVELMVRRARIAEVTMTNRVGAEPAIEAHIRVLREMLADDTWYGPDETEKAAIQVAVELMLRERGPEQQSEAE